MFFCPPLVGSAIVDLPLVGHTPLVGYPLVDLRGSQPFHAWLAVTTLVVLYVNHLVQRKNTRKPPYMMINKPLSRVFSQATPYWFLVVSLLSVVYSKATFLVGSPNP